MGSRILANTVITSEAYGFPPPCGNPCGFNSGLNSLTSGFIQTDDDRMLQVQFINGQLWSSLTTALTIAGETGVRSGAAWFEIHTLAEREHHRQVNGDETGLCGRHIW